MKKNEFAQRIHEVDDKLKDQFSGIENKLRNHAQQIENLVNHLKGKHV
jgi:stearoyl-CoA desaturase (delta-9 desaturase)